MSDVEHIQHADARLSIWREAPSLSGARAAALGAFACADADAGARLVHHAAERLAREGFQALIGPMDGDTWSAHRFVIESDAAAPFLMEPQNPSYYPEAFEAAGFAIVARYASAALPADAPIDAPVSIPGVTLRAFDRACAEQELLRIHALSLRAFAGNAFFKPISVERFLGAYLPIAAIFDPDLTLMAEDEGGDLVGFLFGVANYVEAPPSSIILKTYASCRKGLGSLLAREFHRRARERGYLRVIHALMHESDLSARHSEKLGGRIFRRYALWGKQL